MNFPKQVHFLGAKAVSAFYAGDKRQVFEWRERQRLLYKDATDEQLMELAQDSAALFSYKSPDNFLDDYKCLRETAQNAQTWHSRYKE